MSCAARKPNGHKLQYDNMSFSYVVNVDSDMSLSKGHLGSRGKASKNNLKDTSFSIPMTNVTI